MSRTTIGAARRAAGWPDIAAAYARKLATYKQLRATGGCEVDQGLTVDEGDWPDAWDALEYEAWLSEHR